MRKVANVIERMLNEIPATEHRRFAIYRDRMTDIAHTSISNPTEDDFDKVKHLTDTYIGDPDLEPSSADWRAKVIKILDDAE